MPWRPKVPSPTWRNFLRNYLPDIAAIDMFVVATATFQLLYALIVLSLDRRRVVHFEVTPNPTQEWLSRQKEATDMLGISETTVRSHLKHIFSKTDTARQADLLRLLQNSTPPVRTPQRPDRKATQRRSKSKNSIIRSDDGAAAVHA
jgi:hypothetical protein